MPLDDISEKAAQAMICESGNLLEISMNQASVESESSHTCCRRGLYYGSMFSARFSYNVVDVLFRMEEDIIF